MVSNGYSYLERLAHPNFSTLKRGAKCEGAVEVLCVGVALVEFGSGLILSF